jgi:hypothetical protein
MRHNTDQTPDDNVLQIPASAPYRKGETSCDYPWLDTDDEFDDVEDPDEPELADPHWDAFLADDDELDPQPAPGDFWPDDD